MAGETRQQILEASQKLIQTLGLARVTTKEIAKETGLSEGALYRHFAHKEDVFLAVFEKHNQFLWQFFQEKAAGTGEIEDNLRQICLTILKYYEELIPLTASFFSDTELLNRFRQLLLKMGGPQRLHYWIASYLEEEQRRGRINNELPTMSIATGLLGPVFQYAFLRQLTSEDQFGQTDQKFVDNLIQLHAHTIFPLERG